MARSRSSSGYFLESHDSDPSCHHYLHQTQGLTPSSRSTGAGGTPPGPPRPSRPWSTSPWWSPAPTPPQWCCPTYPVSSSPHAPSGPISPPRSRPWRVAHPHVPGPDHTCPGSGSRPQPSLLAQTLTKDLQSPAPTWPPTPHWHQQPEDQAPPSGVNTSPTPATRGSSAPCPPSPSPHCTPTPSPRPTTSTNATKTNRLRPSRPHPGPPPHPDPTRHDPQPHPLQPTTSHETTHRHLTHHIGLLCLVRLPDWLHRRELYRLPQAAAPSLIR